MPTAVVQWLSINSPLSFPNSHMRDLESNDFCCSSRIIGSFFMPPFEVKEPDRQGKDCHL